MDQVSDKFLNQYLKQTRELYGDDLYLESHDLNSSKKKDVLLNSKLTTYGAYGDTDASLFLVNIELDKVSDEVIGPLIGEAKILLDNILSAIDRSLENDVYICSLLNNLSKIDNPKSNKLTLMEVLAPFSKIYNKKSTYQLSPSSTRHHNLSS